MMMVMNDYGKRNIGVVADRISHTNCRCCLIVVTSGWFMIALGPVSILVQKCPFLIALK